MGLPRKLFGLGCSIEFNKLYEKFQIINLNLIIYKFLNFLRTLQQNQFNAINFSLTKFINTEFQ